MIYDFIIIGAGSAGAHIAYFLNRAGAKVLVVDRYNIASGASSAAGAFVSVRLGRGGILQKITNEAFRFSVDFYKKNFNDYFYQTGILRIPKDREDAEKFSEYEKFLDIDYKKKDSSDLDFLKEYSKRFGGFFFKEAGVVEPVKICKALLDKIEVKENEEIVSIEKRDGIFFVNSYRSNSVILATGAWDELLPKYMLISKVSGIRYDIDSDILPPYSIHQKISISSKINNKIIIGATHNRVENVACKIKPNSFLIDEAKKMIDFKKIEILNLYCGVRPSIYDHLPVIGEIIDLEKSISKYPKLKNGQKIDSKDLVRVENLYIINGLGGRGFVFGSYVANILSLNILKKREIAKELGVERVFFRYMKKNLKKG